MKIKSIKALEILDSRGNPTLETIITLEDGTSAKAMVPSGASTGKHEVFELRDGDMNRYNGMGVLKAVENVNSKINSLLKDSEIEDLRLIDSKMIDLDGTENKSNLGANAILSVSLAAARTLSVYKKEPLWKTIHDSFFYKKTPRLPRIMANIVNGGKHASWNFDIQEFMIIPKKNGAAESIELAEEIFHTLGSILEQSGKSTLKGDEGGYSPKLSSDTEVFEFIERAIADSGHNLDEVDLGIDAAASEYCRKDVYTISHGQLSCNRDELTNYYLDLAKKHPIFSFEDTFAEDDWLGFKKFTSIVGDKCLVVGDDLYTTNPKRIERGILEHATNAILIKPNQIGTVSQTCEAITMAQNAGMKIVVSHRSGETEDSFVSDLAVACAAGFLKAGSFSRSERLAKYNRLIEIEKNEL